MGASCIGWVNGGGGGGACVGDGVIERGCTCG